MEWLKDFLDHRFYDFGVYEDAIVDSEHFLNHSVLTPMLNVGLLTPIQIIDSVLEYAKQNDIPLNSLEALYDKSLAGESSLEVFMLLKERKKEIEIFSAQTKNTTLFL